MGGALYTRLMISGYSASLSWHSWLTGRTYTYVALPGSPPLYVYMLTMG